MVFYFPCGLGTPPMDNILVYMQTHTHTHTHTHIIHKHTHYSQTHTLSAVIHLQVCGDNDIPQEVHFALANGFSLARQPARALDLLLKGIRLSPSLVSLLSHSDREFTSHFQVRSPHSCEESGPSPGECTELWELQVSC